MKKIIYILLISIFILCVFNLPQDNINLKGTYTSSQLSNNYIVQITVDPIDNIFVEYINQRKVDSGNVISNSNNNSYTLKGSKQEFDIILDKENSFNIFIKSINGENPINLKNSNDIIQSYSILFGDEDTYIDLLY